MTDPAPAAPAAPPAAPSATTAPRWRTPVLLAAFTVAIRIPALLATRHLTFDDGVFGASAVAMRDGGVPFRDVFSSQGPLFLPLVFVADLLGLRTLDAPRLLGVAAGVALVLATWAMARRLGRRTGAVIAALLVATSGSILFVTGPLAADGPALAFAALAVACALRYQDSPSLRGALLVGALTGAALMVKALVIPVVVPVGLVLLLARRPKWFVAAVGAAVAMAVVPSVLLGFSDVWDQSIAYHLEVAGDRTPLANLGKVASTFATRDALVLAVAVVGLGTLLVAVSRTARSWPALRRGDGGLTGGAVLGSWLLAVLVVLALEHPLWRPHVAHLVVPIAVLAVLCRPSLRAVVLAALVASPWWLSASLPILWPEPYLESEAQAVEQLQDLPPGALAISDDPGLVYRSGRSTPPDWVDGSILLVETERITEDSIVAEAEQPDVCAVVVWSGRWGDFEDLPARLLDAGYERTAHPEPDKTVYVKPDCTPSP
jgi:4-amino-4-deoxy-L-arabinose transferase-like glycosyltransferase